MDIRSYNKEAWNKQVDGGENRWTKPVDHDVIEKARQGEFGILLTASGGGQQGPVLAAAGANVTVFDNSPSQLKQDQLVAEREALNLKTVEGDAADLSIFADESFDLIFNPVSTVFMRDVRAVWRECYRVLRHGGILLTGSMNPVHYIFDLFKMDEGILEVAYSIPYSDLTSLSDEDREEYLSKGAPLEFGHSLTDLLGSQCAAGFVITDLYEDVMLDSPLGKFHPNYFASRALKV